MNPVSGYQNNRFRHYDSAIGRWISYDPIGYEGGVNLYEYVGNRPYNYIDPLGLEHEWIFLYDEDYFEDDTVADIDFNYSWKCKPDTGELTFTNIPSTQINKHDDQGAKIEATPGYRILDIHTAEVRFIASGSWEEWSVWGAIGGGLTGGVTTAVAITGSSGGANLTNPVGWILTGAGAAGGAVVGALTFSSEKTASLDVKWELKCICNNETKEWEKDKFSPRLIQNNVNNSSGDLYWDRQTW